MQRNHLAAAILLAGFSLPAAAFAQSMAPATTPPATTPAATPTATASAPTLPPAQANMTAPQNMQSYAQLAQVHADGMQKLSAAFQTLYDTFPASQKQIADAVFQNKMTKEKMKS